MKKNRAETGSSGVNLKTGSPFSGRRHRLNFLLPCFIALIPAVTVAPADADEGTVISVAGGTDWTNALARISMDGNGTRTNPKAYTLDIQGRCPCRV
jgi:hypothetical protein